MQKRKLGRSGIQIAPLAFGGNIFGWTVDEPQSFRLLDALLEYGLDFVDTADVYSRWVPGHTGGESETIIGRWLQKSGKRKEVVIATKAGMDMGDGKKGLAKAYLLQSVENSLKRLQTDYIDLFQSHQDDPATPLEETLSAYDQLIREGKVRAIGASNYSAERLAEALAISERENLPRYETLQPHYNLYHREDYEKNLEPLVLEKGLGVITYFSLASGFLTGKYRSEADLSQSPRGQGIKKYLNERGFRILAALDHVAQEHSSAPARVALAWLLTRPGITAPIASATNLNQLQDLVEATKLQLSQSEIDQLNDASAGG